MKPRPPPDRDVFCEACGVLAPKGQRPFEWDMHLKTNGTLVGEMYSTCSPECRKALGLSERKARFEPVPQGVKGW